MEYTHIHAIANRYNQSNKKLASVVVYGHLDHAAARNSRAHTPFFMFLVHHYFHVQQNNIILYTYKIDFLKYEFRHFKYFS